MGEQALTEDEKELLRLLLALADSQHREDIVAEERAATAAILAHYRKAKAEAKGEVAKMLEEMSQSLAEEGHPDLGHQVALAAGAARHMQEGRDPWDPRVERKPTIPAYTAADGTLWVEDPDGTHGWWSSNPGCGDDVDPFQPWAGVVHFGWSHGDRLGGDMLRFYRRVEKR